MKVAPLQTVWLLNLRMSNNLSNSDLPGDRDVGREREVACSAGRLVAVSSARHIAGYWRPDTISR